MVDLLFVSRFAAIKDKYLFKEEYDNSISPIDYDFTNVRMTPDILTKDVRDYIEEYESSVIVDETHFKDYMHNVWTIDTLTLESKAVILSKMYPDVFINVSRCSDLGAGTILQIMKSGKFIVRHEDWGFDGFSYSDYVYTLGYPIKNFRKLCLLLDNPDFNDCFYVSKDEHAKLLLDIFDEDYFS